MMKTWNPGSWRSFPIKQQPYYEDIELLQQIEAQITASPTIVAVEEIMRLQQSLQKVVNGEAIIVHGGDCVETFANINSAYFGRYHDMMHQITALLQSTLNKEVITIGRIAGQFAKPRSHDFEQHIHIYRGDMVNSIERTIQARKADPYRLLEGYHKSVQAYQLLKQHPHYISHEALLLNYEQCLTKRQQNEYFNTSAHLLWVGNRTRSLEGAHIEYIRGIGNPIGIKIDHKVTTDEIIQLIDTVNPDHIPGKLILIFRIGIQKIRNRLPEMLRAIQRKNKEVIYMCDPMHGNTIIQSGKKIRYFASILLELQHFIDILKAEKMSFGGVHLEMANQDIIECVEEDGIMKNYMSYCDPRLNLQQSIKLMKFIGKSLI